MAGLKKTLTTRFHRAQINLAPRKESPDELLGELFQDVQFRRVFPDGITFADMIPASTLRKVLRAYRARRYDPDFDLADFVQSNFVTYMTGQVKYTTNPHHTVEQHIEELWTVLHREVPKNIGSLVGLPFPYVVAGGRFVAQYYWDSYFTMLGLSASGHWDMVENMVKNCAFLIRKFGYVPNASRTYNATRSQPPVFALMVRLLAQKKPKTTLVRYLPYLTAEYNFWMKGARKLHGTRAAYMRVVRLPDGSILNRYFDSKTTPRPESYKEDVDTALRAQVPASRVYLDLRAAAESGWDFSSRWLRNPVDLATVHTTDVLPVDLNCLLVVLEQTIAEGYTKLKQQRMARYYRELAQKRIRAIRTYCWDANQHFFVDYDFVAHSPTHVLSGAGAFALFTDVATQEQADAMAKVLRKRFLQEGGLVCTLQETGQQWDWPNGWAPLQWAAIKGLRNYGHGGLADSIKERWIRCNLNLYKSQRKLVEKYNVVDIDSHAGGGEYSLQDGFGWTNGVLLALLRDKDKEDET